MGASAKAPVFHRSELLEQAGIEHGLGTRRSGHARVPGLVTVRQVHGTALAHAQDCTRSTEADALWSDEPGIAVGVVTADCVPLLLCSPAAGVVAAVHAGWRGSAAGIAERSVAQLARSARVDPAELVAVIGPHIGPCCYEVDEPVRTRIRDDAVLSPAPGEGHYMLDLCELNRRQLVSAGVRAERVERVGGCTACDRSLYASYRRDGSAGRMLHWVRVPRA